MSPWIPTPRAGWPEIAESLARPWPAAAAVTDLRWWAVEAIAARGWLRARRRLSAEERAAIVDAIPGRQTLATRWGWSVHYVRVIVEDEPAWWDDRL